MWARGRVGCGVLAVTMSVGVCGSIGGCSEEAPVVERIESVEVAPAKRGVLKEVVRGVGSIAALDAVLVRAEGAGRVTDIRFEEGEAIERGEVLFSIDAREAEERRRALASAKEAAIATASEAVRTFRRAEELFGRGIVPAQEVDQLRARMEAAQAEVQRLEAEIGSVEEVIARAQVRAPFEGTVTQSEVDPGDFVQAGDPLVTVVRPSGLEAELWLPERLAGRVTPGMPVRVRVGVSDEPLSAEVVFVSPQVDPSSRTVLVKATVSERREALRPGLSATGEIVVGEQEGIVIPERTLVGTREGYRVYVVEDGVARERAVEIGLREPGRVLIRAGLEPGALVVEQGQDRISDGDRVQVTRGAGEALAMKPGA